MSQNSVILICALLCRISLGLSDDNAAQNYTWPRCLSPDRLLHCFASNETTPDEFSGGTEIVDDVVKRSLDARFPITDYDLFSHSRPDLVRVTHYHLSLQVHFDRQQFVGHVDLNVTRIDPTAHELILDIHSLRIRRVTNLMNGNPMPAVAYSVRNTTYSEFFGSKLVIPLPVTTENDFYIRVTYTVLKGSPSFTWLEPSMTSRKLQPFVFAQNQFGNTRGMMPCQDTARNFATFSAQISHPVNSTATMSAYATSRRVKKANVLQTTFIQDQPIPSYLMVLAIGDLKPRRASKRVILYAEPTIVAEAEKDLSELEHYLSLAEKYFSGAPYRWNEYNVVVMPPAFAYGGMENPLLTYVSPTVITGDKSMMDVLIHEIVHSWMGNTVTAATLNHIWLNEGFTMYVERAISGMLHGEPYRHLSFIVGQQVFKSLLSGDKMSSRLVNDIRQTVDPGTIASPLYYEKGAMLLFHLEQLLEAKQIQKFLSTFAKTFSQKAIVSEQFVGFLYDYFEEKRDILNQVDWHAWLYSPGEPPVYPRYDHSLATIADKLASRWNNFSVPTTEFSASDIAKFLPLQLEYFTQRILAYLTDNKMTYPAERLETMTKIYQLDAQKNKEIRVTWLLIGLASKWENILDPAADFLESVGRLKYLISIFRAVKERWPEQLPWLKRLYLHRRTELMSVTQRILNNILEVPE